MESERKINMSEGVPLNTGAANIFLNTGSCKTNSSNGTVIHLNTDKSSHPDVGLHIDTTFAIASSKKKKKLLIILTFLPSVICIIISCSIAYYYWNEMVSMKKQLDSIKILVEEHYLHNKELTSQSERPQHDALVAFSKPIFPDTRESRMQKKSDLNNNIKKYYVEGLGQDMWLVDLSKKPTEDNTHYINSEPIDTPLKPKSDVLIAHFNGAMREINLGVKGVIGPWTRDAEVSTKGSEDKLELQNDAINVHEGGLYLVYSQITYLSHAPNCYLIWARQQDKEPRLVASCSTGDDASNRPLEKSQMSCSTQTITRLYKGDTINLSQRENNRTLLLRPGRSYLGFMKISS